MSGKVSAKDADAKTEASEEASVLLGYMIKLKNYLVPSFSSCLTIAVPATRPTMLGRTIR
jgi:hypothetical protein